MLYLSEKSWGKKRALQQTPYAQGIFFTSKNQSQDLLDVEDQEVVFNLKALTHQQISAVALPPAVRCTEKDANHTEFYRPDKSPLSWTSK